MTTYSGKDFWQENPTKWPTVPLRKVARLGTGHTPSRSVEEYWQNCTIPWVTTEDLTARRGAGLLRPLMKTRQHISELGLAHSAAELHPAGTVMLSRTASVGHVARVGKPMATTQAFVTWTCSEGLEPRYLAAVLLAMNPEFFRLAYGSTHLTIYMPDIEQLRVPLPPLAEQRAIADYLDAETARIDALIAKKQQLIRLLEERWRAIVDTTIEGLPGPRVPLRRFVRLITQGVSPQAGSAPYSPGRRGLLKLSAVRFGEYRPEENKELDADFDTSRALAPSRGDLLVTRANTPQLVGDACAVREPDPNVVLCDLIYLLRLDDRMTAEFAAYTLISGSSRHAFTSLARGTSQSMVKLRGEDVLSVGVPVPPMCDQVAIVEQMDFVRAQLRQAAGRLARQIDLLAEHRQALITASVTGEGGAMWRASSS